MTEYVEVARAESERGEVVLRRRVEERAADTLELRVNGVFVMDTRETTSEIELAGAALELVEDPRDVVVGGLGLGYTTQRVLADHRVEQVKVVEIEEALVGWMRDGTVPHGPAVLADRRVHVVNADIMVAVAEATSTYDLVLLDVDNGPGFLVYDANAGIYERAFLTSVRRILNPGGALVIWSASPAPELTAVMEEVFGNCTEQSHDVLLQERPEHYLLYLARA
ncbi:MAG: spermidine synthase [Marmoricola sp.]|jgi:spermidine synthase|nr:spermidine synthase [Marmoricola sp.]